MNKVFYQCATAAMLVRRKYNYSIPLLVFPGRFCSYWKPNFPAVSGSYLPGFYGRICSYWQSYFPAVSGSYLLGFSGRICSYWQPNFPAVSVVTCRDFLALPFLAPEGRDFPALSVVSGRGISGRSFSGMGNLKNLYGQQTNCSGIYSGIFCPLIREFSGGKLKQKGFFHSVKTCFEKEYLIFINKEKMI
jgi:hypothetical protein